MRIKSYITAIPLVLAMTPGVLEAQALKSAVGGTNAVTQVRHQAIGVVKGVDPKAGTATIEHGPVKTLNWPGMTMPFNVPDPDVRAKLVVGKKVEFEFEQRGTTSVIVSIK